MSPKETLAQHLDKHQVKYQFHDHEPLRTVEDMVRVLGLPVELMLKAVAFRIKDGDFILAAMQGANRVDYKRLAALFGVNRRALRPLAPEAVRSELGYEIGGVSPVALRSTVHVVFDQSVVALDKVYCGSGVPTATLEVNMADLLRLDNVLSAEITKRPS